MAWGLRYRDREKGIQCGFKGGGFRGRRHRDLQTIQYSSDFAVMAPGDTPLLQLDLRIVARPTITRANWFIVL